MSPYVEVVSLPADEDQRDDLSRWAVLASLGALIVLVVWGVWSTAEAAQPAAPGDYSACTMVVGAEDLSAGC